VLVEWETRKKLEVEFLLDFLMDITNLQLDYTLYVGLIIGLTVKYFWVWNIDIHFLDSISPSSEWSFKTQGLTLQMKRQLTINEIFIWLIKLIRRKESPGEEPIPSIS
jgi:hypothetical protein